VVPYEVPDFWLPISPDLIPTDYKNRGIIQQQIYQTKVQDLNVLMQHLIDVWPEAEQSIIDRAIDQLCKRLLSVPAFKPEEDILNIHKN